MQLSWFRAFSAPKRIFQSRRLREADDRAQARHFYSQFFFASLWQSVGLLGRLVFGASLASEFPQAAFRRLYCPKRECSVGSER